MQIIRIKSPVKWRKKVKLMICNVIAVHCEIQLFFIVVISNHNGDLNCSTPQWQNFRVILSTI